MDDNASTGGKGTSWSSARKYLQDALADAEYGDEIWVAEGTYKPNQRLKKTDGGTGDTFNLVNGVKIFGGFIGNESERTPLGDSNKTILSGEISTDNWSSRIVTAVNVDSNTTIDGFLITKGENWTNKTGLNWGRGYGGGLYISVEEVAMRSSLNPMPSLNVRNCTFKENRGNFGGAIAISWCAPHFENCIIDKNFCSNGGGIFCGSYATPTFIKCRISNNEAFLREDGYGGGIYIKAGNAQLILIDCVIADNSSGAGGGIHGFGGARGSLSLINCIFENNSAKSGGGAIYLQHGGSGYLGSTLIRIVNCIFFQNKVVGKNGNWGHGGAIYLSIDGTLTTEVSNCIFIGNSAKNPVSSGAAIYSGNEAPLIIDNSIFWNNLTYEYLGHGFQDSSRTPWETSTPDDATNILQNWDGDTRAFSSDPLFIDIENPKGTDGKWFTPDDGLKVKIGSPAIDNGNKNVSMKDVFDMDKDGNKKESFPYDFIGNQRFQGTAVDIGLYEHSDPSISIETIVMPKGTGIVDGGGIFLIGSQISLEATSIKTGYHFTGWSGDINGADTTLTFIANSSKSIIVNFAQDLNDSDNDGLSNYNEIVTYKTDMNKADSDGDGILDGQEVQIGSDPNRSDYSLYNFAKSKGEQTVLDNPSQYNLVTQLEYNKLLETLESNSTPYTNRWFYQPDKGWLWTTRTTYPYFYDSASKAWMYFQSGNEKPKFYHYGTKTWMTVE